MFNGMKPAPSVMILFPLFLGGCGHWTGEGMLKQPELTSIAGATSTAAVAVGREGLAIHWDGVEWREASSTTAFDLNAVWMDPDSTAWAVGMAGTILRWTGGVWAAVESGTDRDLLEVGRLEDGTLVASGRKGTLLIWTGEEWAMIETPTTGPILRFCGTIDDLYLGVIDSYTQTGRIGLGVLHFDGTTWSAVPGPGRYRIIGMGFDSQRGLYIMENKGCALRASEWNGAEWTPLDSIRTASSCDFLEVVQRGPDSRRLVACGGRHCAGPSEFVYELLLFDGSRWTPGGIETPISIWGAPDCALMCNRLWVAHRRPDGWHWTPGNIGYREAPLLQP